MDEPEKTTRVHVGLMFGPFKVIRATRKTATILLQTETDLGRKVGKPLTFRYDGTGFKRQGQYLRTDGTIR